MTIHQLKELSALLHEEHNKHGLGKIRYRCKISDNRLRDFMYMKGKPRVDTYERVLNYFGKTHVIVNLKK